MLSSHISSSSLGGVAQLRSKGVRQGMKTFGDKMATSVFNPASLINFENKKKNYTNTSCSDYFGQIK